VFRIEDSKRGWNGGHRIEDIKRGWNGGDTIVKY
jgi:hypothetical protein